MLLASLKKMNINKELVLQRHPEFQELDRYMQDLRGDPTPHLALFLAKVLSGEDTYHNDPKKVFAESVYSGISSFSKCPGGILAKKGNLAGMSLDMSEFAKGLQQRMRRFWKAVQKAGRDQVLFSPCSTSSLHSSNFFSPSTLQPPALSTLRSLPRSTTASSSPPPPPPHTHTHMHFRPPFIFLFS